MSDISTTLPLPSHIESATPPKTPTTLTTPQ